MREGSAQRRVPRRLTGSVTAGPWRAHCSSCRRSVAARRGRTDRPPAECKPCRLRTECYKSARDFAPRSNHALGILKDKVSVVERRSNPRSARIRNVAAKAGVILTSCCCFCKNKPTIVTFLSRERAKRPSPEVNSTQREDGRVKRLHRRRCFAALRTYSVKYIKRGFPSKRVTVTAACGCQLTTASTLHPNTNQLIVRLYH